MNSILRSRVSLILNSSFTFVRQLKETKLFASVLMVCSNQSCCQQSTLLFQGCLCKQAICFWKIRRKEVCGSCSFTHSHHTHQKKQHTPWSERPIVAALIIYLFVGQLFYTSKITVFFLSFRN